jgi:hypothetical protein
MPKTKSTYINQIKFNASDKMLMLISNARRSKGAKDGFGVVPSQTEFLRGVIYYWVRKNAPEMLDMNGEIPEVLEHKALKENHKAMIDAELEKTKEYFKNRKK